MRITKPAYRVACMRAGVPADLPEYVPPPLPAAAAEYWDCRRGYAYGVAPKIAEWRGQIRGVLLTQPNAARQPTLAYDTVLSTRWPIMHFVRSSAQNIATQATLSVPLTLAGTRPWHYSYFRYRTVPGGTKQVSINYLHKWPTGINYGAGMFYIEPNDNMIHADFWDDGNPAVLAKHTNPMRAEGYRRAHDGALTARFNGGAEITKGSGYYAPSPTGAVQFGGNYGSYFSDLSLAFSMVATAVPSAAELAALYAWTFDAFGGPPIA